MGPIRVGFVLPELEAGNEDGLIAFVRLAGASMADAVDRGGDTGSGPAAQSQY